MAEEPDDPREVPWHPRLAEKVLGHARAQDVFRSAFASGRPHHAWLMTGARGIGKATLAYKLAEEILTGGHAGQSRRWIAARAHPDLFVLERSIGDQKPRRLRQEISVDDARRMSEFFARTSGSGGWRVGIVDCADDLNTESANALLKLIEEPPGKALILLVCHQPGRLLRTLRSRCMRLPLEALSDGDVETIVRALPLPAQPEQAALDTALRLSGGSPGRALELIDSEGARAFDAFTKAKHLTPATRIAIAGRFAQRQAAVGDFETFVDLLLEWLARESAAAAASATGLKLAEAHRRIAELQAIAAGYNLDRRNAVIAALGLVEDALKAA